MTRNEVIPGFDCVESKRRAQARIRKDARGLSPEEEIRYFEQEALRGPLGELWRKLKANQPPRRGGEAEAD